MTPSAEERAGEKAEPRPPEFPVEWLDRCNDLLRKGENVLPGDLYDLVADALADGRASRELEIEAAKAEAARVFAIAMEWRIKWQNAKQRIADAPRARIHVEGPNGEVTVRFGDGLLPGLVALVPLPDTEEKP